MKKKILFVNESLTLAGGEKSLIALLNNINQDLYHIDLQLFRYGEALDSFIPEYVNILPPLAYTQYASSSWRRNIIDALKGKGWRHLLSKLSYSIKLRQGKYNHPEKAQLYWEATQNAFQVSEEEYDVAIAYAQGVPTFYVMDKVVAKQRFCWVNANLSLRSPNKGFQESYYRRYDVIVPVSTGTKEWLQHLFPHLSQKYKVIKDILDYTSIRKMAESNPISLETEKFNILTVSRLSKKMKGMDITMETCRVLKERKINFHWLILGDGDYREEMKIFIHKNGLNDYVTLLGTTANPYPYYKAADLYVQTSRQEGFGMSIAEARLLNTPVVTTCYDTVFTQMKHERNGLVMDMNATAVADGIERIMKDKDLYHSIVTYLEQEPKENLESVEQFNQLVVERLSSVAK